MRRRYADLSQGQLHYRETGEGRPLLLFHQTASSSTMFERCAPHLAAAGFHVLAPDTPGFGLSDPLPQKPTMRAYAAVMAELMEHLGLDTACAAGFHTGAHIALELAAQQPDRIEKAVLVGVLPMKDDADRESWRKQIVKPWTPDWDCRFLEPNVALLQSYMDRSDHEGMWLELTQRLLAGGDYWHAYDAVVDHDAVGAAASLKVPALYVNPTGDMLIEPTKWLHERTPGAAYAEMPGGSDAVMMHPAEFASVVAGFCR